MSATSRVTSITSKREKPKKQKSISARNFTGAQTTKVGHFKKVANQNSTKIAAENFPAQTNKQHTLKHFMVYLFPFQSCPTTNEEYFEFCHRCTHRGLKLIGGCCIQRLESTFEYFRCVTCVGGLWFLGAVKKGSELSYLQIQRAQRLLLLLLSIIHHIVAQRMSAIVVPAPRTPSILRCCGENRHKIQKINRWALENVQNCCGFFKSLSY